MINSRDDFSARVEQGERSEDGSWYVLNLVDLFNYGYQFIEVHFPDSGDSPDDVRITDQEGL